VPEPGEFYRFPNKCLHSHGAWGGPGLSPRSWPHAASRGFRLLCSPTGTGVPFAAAVPPRPPPAASALASTPPSLGCRPGYPPFPPPTPDPSPLQALGLSFRTIFQYEVLCIISARVWLLAACCARWCCVTLPHDLPLGTCRSRRGRPAGISTCRAHCQRIHAHHWRPFHTQCGPRRLACE
jgi:hypothetical protein